jgi:hypothetical protein
MSTKENKQVESALEGLQKGDVIRLTYEDIGRFSSDRGSVELVVVEVPENPTKSVIETYTSDADLEKDAEEIIKSGADHVNIQSSRRNSSARSQGYRYETRCMLNDEYDAKAIINIDVTGSRVI